MGERRPTRFLEIEHFDNITDLGPLEIKHSYSIADQSAVSPETYITTIVGPCLKP